MFPPNQCIFCNSPSAVFTTIEHIVPESLGNTEHTLPIGVVCDSCNNYFARKIEGPILDSDFFRQARHRNRIPNKRKRIPIQEAIAFPYMFPIEMGFTRDGMKYICSTDEAHNEDFENLIQRQLLRSAVFPVAHPPEERIFSRFLLKMGLEALAARMLTVENGIKIDHIENPVLDEARLFVRFGIGPNIWRYHETCLYDEAQRFFDRDEPYDIPHEYTLLYTDEQEMYFIVAIFGVQYSINLGGPEIDGFHCWLTSHDNASPLYPTGT